jgi:thiol:disulfide interchange protein DsbG
MTSSARLAIALGVMWGAMLVSPARADTIPKSLEPLRAAGYQIGKHFDAGHGLTGWVVTYSGQTKILFTTADGEGLISGSLFDAEGHNLSAGFGSQYIVKTDLKPVYADLAKSSFVAEHGPGAVQRIIYVLFDPNCPYCSVAWKALRPYIGAGLEVRWVPVAYLQSDSAPKAAAILGAKDPLAALKSNEESFDAKAHEGGIPAAASVPDAVAGVLKHNEELMGRLGSSATPTFVWIGADKEIQTQAGLPPPLKMLEIVGLASPDVGKNP